MPEKQYGLILPKKKLQISPLGARPLNRAFDSGDELESEEDKEESPLNWIEATLKKSAGNAGQQSTQKRILRDALEEDSTIFQYDEVYNEMKSTQNAKQEEKKQKDKPKYIATILKQAEKRKLDFERLKERKVQKEREAEGDQFADKESFVTPAYLKKLEELKKAEEEEARQKLLEEKNDLLKHKNFGAFYSHLYQQKVGGATVEVKQEPPDEDEPSEDASRPIRQEGDGSPLPENRTPKTEFKKESQRDKEHRARQYRKRSSSRSPKRNPSRKRRSASSGSDSSSPPRRKRGKGDGASPSRSGQRSEKERHGDSSRKKLGRSGSSSFQREKAHSRTKDRSKNPNSSRGDTDSHSEEDCGFNGDNLKGIKQENIDADSPSASPESNTAKELPCSIQNGDSKDKIEEKALHRTKEPRVERIRQLFTKRTQGAIFDDAVARYFVRLSQREAVA